MDSWSLRQLFTFEAVFIAFLYAGIYKTHPALTWVPIDITVLLLFATGAIGLLLWFRDAWGITPIIVVFIAIYLIFLAYVSFSIFWSSSSIYAQYKLIRLVTVVPGAIGGAILIGQSRERFYRFLRLTVGLGTLLSSIVILQFLSGSLQGGFRIGEAAYLLPSRVIAISGLISVFWLSKTRNFRIRLALIGLVGIHSIGVFLGSSRGALIAMFAAIGLFAVLQMWSGGYYIRLTHEIQDLVVTGVIGGIGIIIGIVGGLIELSSFRIVRRTLRLFSPSQTETSLLSRMEHYQFAFDLWIRSPIFGHGIGSYGILQTGEDTISYPHNILLEVLAELGLFGLFLVCLLVVVGIVRIYRYRLISEHSTRSFLISFAFFWFVSAQFSFDITGNRYLFMCLALFCVSYNVLDINNTNVSNINHN